MPLPLVLWVTLAKLLSLYKIQPPHLLNGDNNIIYKAWFLERLSGIVHGKHLAWCQAQRKYLISGHYSAAGGAGVLVMLAEECNGGGDGSGRGVVIHGSSGHGDGDVVGGGGGGIWHGVDDDGRYENVDDATGILASVHVGSEHPVIKSEFRTF